MGPQGVRAVRLRGGWLRPSADGYCPNCGQRIRVAINSKYVRSGGRTMTLDWAEFIHWPASMRDSEFSELIQVAENSSVGLNSVLFLVKSR